MDITLVKLGGSVITDKSKPFHAKTSVIKRLAQEIEESGMIGKLMIGHGSGSFGHTVAAKYEKPYSVEVVQDIHRAAQELHGKVMNQLPSAVDIELLQILKLSSSELIQLLQEQKMPVVYGNILPADAQIYSTEKIFSMLMHTLSTQDEYRVTRVILVTDVDGIRRENSEEIFERLTMSDREQVLKACIELSATDVTGGMLQKATYAFAWAQKGVEVLFINGTVPGRLSQALAGKSVVGTILTASTG